MFQRDSITFGKSHDCPTSDRMLAFRKKELGNYASDVIKDHLAECDFCSAEFEFFQKFPFIPEEQVRPTLIPEHLYELAAALLENGESGIVRLRSLVSEPEDN